MANKSISLSTEERAYLKACMVGSTSLTLEEVDRLDSSIIKKLDRADKRIKIASAKVKGRSLQQKVGQRIADVTGTKYGSLDTDDVGSRPMGQCGTDVILRGEALKKFPYSVECKSSESFSFVDTVEQVKYNQERYKLKSWIIFHKRKAIPETLAVMDSEEFFRIYSGYLKGETKK